MLVRKGFSEEDLKRQITDDWLERQETVYINGVICLSSSFNIVVIQSLLKSETAQLGSDSSPTVRGMGKPALKRLRNQGQEVHI